MVGVAARISSESAKMISAYRSLAALLVVSLPGCASALAPSAVGLQPIERRILRGGTVWLTDPGPYAATPSRHSSVAALRGEPGALQQFLRRSLAKLDGENAETYTHDAYLLLFELGDVTFARALAVESVPVRRQMSRRFSYIFTYWHLSYPQTQAALAL